MLFLFVISISSYVTTHLKFIIFQKVWCSIFTPMHFLVPIRSREIVKYSSGAKTQLRNIKCFGWEEVRNFLIITSCDGILWETTVKLESVRSAEGIRILKHVSRQNQEVISMDSTIRWWILIFKLKQRNSYVQAIGLIQFSVKKTITNK